MKLDPWMTPAPLAAAILRWTDAGAHPAGHGRTDRSFLEPSAGEGAFALPLARVPGIDLTCVEMHGGRAEALRAKLADIPATASTTGDVDGNSLVRLVRRQVVCRDFVAWAEEHAEARPADLFDLSVGNPPYSDDQDCDHVAAALRISWRVVALLRLTFLAGSGRAETIFRSAHLRRLAVLTTRPSYIDRSDAAAKKEGSPRHDFAVFEFIPKGAMPTPPPQSIEFWDASYRRIA